MNREVCSAWVTGGPSVGAVFQLVKAGCRVRMHGRCSIHSCLLYDQRVVRIFPSSSPESGPSHLMYGEAQRLPLSAGSYPAEERMNRYQEMSLGLAGASEVFLKPLGANRKSKDDRDVYEG